MKPTAPAKRLLDTILVLLAAPLWLPLAALVALCVLAVEGRPVLFSQMRAGLGGRPFRLFKFRTMRVGGGTDGERLTAMGRFLRKTSLDELPELLLVLAGRMSLVGPRPLPVAYLPRYSPEQARRHEVLPGITGWAQVHGRNAISWEEKFAYDVWYVDNRSLWLDARILLMTVRTVLGAAGVSAAGEATASEFMGAERGGGGGGEPPCDGVERTRRR